ncbi:hypothetical protein F4804DRAFT_317259, partial [Jackrogersella minutella]
MQPWTLQAQSTPFLYWGKKTLVVLAGRNMYQNDRFNNRPYWNGENGDVTMMKEILQIISQAEGMKEPHTEFFPYYTVSPWFYEPHDNLQWILVSFPDLPTKATPSLTREQNHMWRYLEIVRPM